MEFNLLLGFAPQLDEFARLSVLPFYVNDNNLLGGDSLLNVLIGFVLLIILVFGVLDLILKRPLSFYSLLKSKGYAHIVSNCLKFDLKFIPFF